ncbi:MAG: neutral/alkaline non-lysosomal ceramidase N-terminal domain-containing protein [Verrucomicrobia bacterium]|nr:neutral/alkaline non-lysosomal ceramidase N-terminal domain-containing protein [Verrucomicrobiota bacterium]
MGIENRKPETGNPIGLRAGFGRADITPGKPCFLVGYPHVERISTGTHDPLLASALSLESGGRALIFLSVDLLFVSPGWTRDCRVRISDATGIPPENILIGATHTHSGPLAADLLVFKGDPVVPPCDPEYLEFSCGETAKAAIKAWRALEPAEIAMTSANVAGLAGGNRIDPNGPEDPDAGLLLVRRPGEGGPLAILSIYGMHPTVLHEDSTLFSGDFIAFTRTHLEKVFGAGLVYLNGVSGNQSPRRFVRAQTFAEAERLGLALGARIEGALHALTGFQTNITLDSSMVKIPLEGKAFPSKEAAAIRLEEARKNYEELKLAQAGHAKVRTAECTVFGAEEVLTLAIAEASGEAEAVRQQYREAEIQVFRVGDTAVVAWPGEFFVEYGLEVKSLSPLRAFVTTMANGELQGYIVTPEAESAGGYEAQMAVFPAAMGKRFVESTIALIGRITCSRDETGAPQ